MKKGIKEQIVAVACTLFNEYGYDAVSMRQIAEALGISVGNLTYYFKHKGDLVAAVIIGQHKQLPSLSVPQTLQQIDSFFRFIIKRQQDNSYFFRHFTQLASAYPPIYQKQLHLLQEHFSLLNQSFDKLRADGLMAAEEMEGQQAHLVLALMMVYIYWTPQVPFAQQIYPNHEMRRCLWSLVLPHLTEQGKRVYRETVAE